MILIIGKYFSTSKNIVIIDHKEQAAKILYDTYKIHYIAILEYEY